MYLKLKDFELRNVAGNTRPISAGKLNTKSEGYVQFLVPVGCSC